MAERAYAERQLEKDVQNFKNVMDIPIWTGWEETTADIFPKI
jgi:hypothetical protein